MADDDWTVVGGNGKPRKSQPSVAATTPAMPQPQVAESSTVATETSLPGWSQPSNTRRQRSGRGFRERTPEQKVADHCTSVKDCKREVAEHPVFTSLKVAVEMASQAMDTSPDAAGQPAEPLLAHAPTLPSVLQLVVYGLGCIEDSRVSRYQLSLALLLRDMLPNLATNPELFDPAFSDMDRMIMKALDLNAIEINESGARPVTSPTLFYLPHCEAALCDNVLAANWAPQQLPNVIILGNSFSHYAERFSMRGTNPNIKRPEKMLQLLKAGAVLEIRVPDHRFHVASAFNDMSLHLFSAAKVAEAEGLWE